MHWHHFGWYGEYAHHLFCTEGTLSLILSHLCYIWLVVFGEYHKNYSYQMLAHSTPQTSSWMKGCYMEGSEGKGILSFWPKVTPVLSGAYQSLLRIYEVTVCVSAHVLGIYQILTLTRHS